MSLSLISLFLGSFSGLRGMVHIALCKNSGYFLIIIVPIFDFNFEGRDY